MFFRIQILGVFIICAVPSVLAQTANQQTKPRSHVERFATAEMRAEKAEAETVAKLAVNPNDAETLNARALARMRLGKYAEALEDLLRAVRLDAKSSEYQANLGYAFWKLGKPEDAVKAERAALALDEKNFTAHYQLGRFLLRLGDEKQAKEALTHLKRALELDPRQYEVRFELIAVYRSLNDLANAAAQLELLQDARPADARVDYIRALLAVDRNETNAAIKNFEEALRKDNNLLGAWQDLGLTYIKLKRWTEAADTFAELVKRQPEAAEVAYFYALSLYNAGKSAEAETQARRALRLNAGVEEAHTLLGIILASRGGANAEAIESLMQAVALDPKSFDAVFYLGRVQYAAKEYAASAKSLQTAIALNPKNAEARFFLGTILEANGDSAAALKEYEELVKLEPNSIFGQLGLGALLVKQGKTAEAVAALRQATRLNPQNFEAHWALGRALMLSEKFAEAVEALNKAVALAPERAEAHYQLGLALRRLGKTAEAAREFETVNRLNKEFRTNATDKP
ncbi:MAG: tetratricopeptide repeat protein [Acidobacteria bacterium]|nr:tetratricopeptide repeat protein [Acidobacteriota bacterium]